MIDSTTVAAWAIVAWVLVDLATRCVVAVTVCKQRSRPSAGYYMYPASRYHHAADGQDTTTDGNQDNGYLF